MATTTSTSSQCMLPCCYVSGRCTQTLLEWQVFVCSKAVLLLDSHRDIA